MDLGSELNGLSPRARLLRAAAIGLAAGFFLGGLYLLAVGGRSIAFGVDCAGATPEQCALERELAVQFARRQVLTGGALALLAVAIAMWIRARFGGRLRSDRKQP
jgi:hypothetical protein